MSKHDIIGEIIDIKRELRLRRESISEQREKIEDCLREISKEEDELRRLEEGLTELRRDAEVYLDE